MDRAAPLNHVKKVPVFVDVHIFMTLNEVFFSHSNIFYDMCVGRGSVKKGVNNKKIKVCGISQLAKMNEEFTQVRSCCV